MTVLDVRRHAERGLSGALTERGAAGARAIAGIRYALVVASPLERAKRTAELAGGRLDAVEPGLLPDVGGALVFGPMPELADWRDLLRGEPKARAFAAEQLGTWAALAGRVGEGERVLAVSHGGIIELPVIALAERLGVPIEGPSFGYLEGARITYAKGVPTALALLRATQPPN